METLINVAEGHIHEEVLDNLSEISDEDSTPFKAQATSPTKHRELPPRIESPPKSFEMPRNDLPSAILPSPWLKMTSFPKTDGWDPTVFESSQQKSSGSLKRGRPPLSASTMKKSSPLADSELSERGIKSFNCSYEGCSRVFKSKSHLTRHVRSHTGKI